MTTEKTDSPPQMASQLVQRQMVAVEIRLGRRRIGEMVEETVPQYLQQAVADDEAQSLCQYLDMGNIAIDPPTHRLTKYNLFILEGINAWSDPKRKERRTFHANGDGTFVVDGRTIDLKKKMVKWQSLL
jgi:hypothetical protein